MNATADPRHVRIEIDFQPAKPPVEAAGVTGTPADVSADPGVSAAAIPPWVIPLVTGIIQLIGLIRGGKRAAVLLFACLALPLCAGDASAGCRGPLARLIARPAPPRPAPSTPAPPRVEYRILPVAPAAPCGPGGCPVPARR
jgi:hypothetical protein